MLLGYPNDVKGYKLLDLDINSIFVSHDVVFHESISPFHSFDIHTIYHSHSPPSHAPPSSYVLPNPIHDLDLSICPLPTSLPPPHTHPDAPSSLLRWCTYVSHLSRYLHDYTCSFVSNHTLSPTFIGKRYNIFHTLSFSKLSPARHAFFLFVCTTS